VDRNAQKINFQGRMMRSKERAGASIFHFSAKERVDGGTRLFPPPRQDWLSSMISASINVVAFILGTTTFSLYLVRRQSSSHY